MSEIELDIDKYEEELLKYIRKSSDGDKGVALLTDDSISYLLTLWDEYLDTLELDEDEDDFDVDSDDLYSYIQDAIADDEVKLEVSLETLICLIEMEEDFVDSLFDDDDE